MANVKITDLSALTNPASTDVLAIVDVGTDVTKKVTIADLLENAGDGTAAAPAFSFDSDSNSGLYREGADKLGFSTNGVGRVYIDGSGNVGISQVNPSAPLEFGKAVYGTNSSENFYRIKFNNLTNTVNDIGIGQPDANSIALNSSNNGSIIFYQGSDGEVARFHTNGYLGIGNSTPTRTLDVTGTAAVSGALTAGSAAVTGTLTQGGNNVVTVGDTGTVTSTMIDDNTIVDADINASAAIGLSKLATGALPTGITVASANIVDGTIVDADVNASAAIGLSKLATGALPTGITVASANIVDGTIVDADVSATAEIAVSKLANGTARQLLQTDAAGTGVEFTSNVDVPGTLDVSSTAVFDGNVGIGTSGPTSKLHLSSATGSASPIPTELTIGTSTNASDWSVTDPWGKISFYSEDGSGGGPKVHASINTIASITNGGSSDLTFNVDGSEHLRIKNTGNVGIGTSSPDRLLEIAGSGGASNVELRINATDGGERQITFTGAGSTTQTIKSTGTTNNSLVFLQGPNERARIDSSGNVGIGTSSPTSLLHLASNAPYITFEDIDNNQDWQLQATAWFALRNQTTNSELLRITSSGNVGIGTTSPFTTLHVLNDGTGTDVATSGTTDTTTAARIGRDSIGIDIGVLNNGTSYLQNRSVTNFATNYNFVINPNGGNVGIGTDSPDYKLDINAQHARIGDGTTTGIIQYGSNSTASNNFHLGAANGLFRLWNGNIGTGTEILRINSTGGVSWDNGGSFLDDYEEGSWTPTVIGNTSAGTVTYQRRSATYTKVGNVVTIQCNVQWNNGSGGTGVLRITGLPFVSKNSGPTTNLNFAAGYASSIQTMREDSVIYAYIPNNSSYLQLDNYVARANAATTAWTSSGTFGINMSYFTDA